MTAVAVALNTEITSAHKPMSLNALQQNRQARIVSIDENGSLGERMLEMGLTPGTTVAVVRHGPLGDPLQLLVRGTYLSIRRALAASVQVEPA